MVWFMPHQHILFLGLPGFNPIGWVKPFQPMVEFSIPVEEVVQVAQINRQAVSQATFPHFYSSVYTSLSHFSYLQFELCRYTPHLWTNFKISTEPGPAAAPHIFTGNLIETQRWRHQQRRKPPKHGTAAPRRHRQRQKSGSLG